MKKHSSQFRHAWLIVLLFILILTAGFAPTVQALLPEPPNIVYGEVTAGVTTVTAKISGLVVATYTMGLNPKIPANMYILIIPLDALNPQTPGTTRPGQVVSIYFGTTLAGSTVVGPRGTVSRIGGSTGNSFLLWTK